MKTRHQLALAFAILAGALPASAVDLAKVNGRAITEQDLQASLGGFNDGQRAGLLRDPSTRRQLVLGLVDQELLTQQGEKEKLDQDAEYKKALESFRRQYLAARIIQKNLGAKLTPSALKRYYDQNRDRFSTDQVHVQHILAENESKAREALAKAKAAGADFQALAESLSRDPSAKNNRGDIGFINRDAPFVEEFKEAAFNAPDGEIVGPVKTSFGYHVIKVVERKKGKPLEYHEVELKVRAELERDLVRTYLGELKKTAKISLDEKAIEKL